MIRLCPICKTTSDSDHNPDFPFCTPRCRLLDLGNWAAEKYVVSEPVIDEDSLDENSLNVPSPPKHDASKN